MWKPLQYNAVKPADSIPEASSAVPETTVAVHPAEEALNAVFQKKLRCLRPLGDITALSSDSIEELRDPQSPVQSAITTPDEEQHLRAKSIVNANDGMHS